MRVLLASLALISALSAHAAAQETPTAHECTPSRRIHCPASLDVVALANEAALQRPTRARFSAARQIYSYAPGAIYALPASPAHISSILLERGETVTAIAAGDTSRWTVSEVEAEAQEEPRAIVLVKPLASGIETNIVIVTDRRSYVIEARAGGGAYAAEIAWTYPVRAEAAIAPDLERLSFDYRVRVVRGAAPRWLPSRVFDDGRQTVIEFPAEVAAADMPPLFVITAEGAELANYRVEGRRMSIDRIFDAAELRLGVRAPVVVRIERVPNSRTRRIGGQP